MKIDIKGAIEMYRFDKFEKEIDKEFNKAKRLVMMVWIVCFLAGVSLFGGIAYVAVHFLSKIW